jgi:hypothetical protein
MASTLSSNLAKTKMSKNQQFFHETGGSFRGLKNVELSGSLILFFFQVARIASHWLIQAATSAFEWHL